MMMRRMMRKKRIRRDNNLTEIGEIRIHLKTEVTFDSDLSHMVKCLLRKVTHLPVAPCTFKMVTQRIRMLPTLLR